MNERATEWLNQNANRRYPFIENTDMVAASTGARLPDNFLLDFNTVLYDTNYSTDVLACLQTVEILGTGPYTVIVTLAIETDPLAPLVVFTLSSSGTYPYVAQIHSAGIHTTAAVFGAGVQEFAEQYGASLHPFDNLPFEPARICVQSKRRVDSIVGTQTGSVPITGDIYVKEGYNCSIALITGVNASYPAVVRGSVPAYQWYERR
jgi:hypothetical protein